MPLLIIADSAYLWVQDVNSAAAWYMEKLDLKQSTAYPEQEEGCVYLASSQEDTAAFVLGPPGLPDDRRDSPMLYTANIEKARKLLISRGVYVGEIEVDRQGTHYFSVRDLEGNEIEVTEEP